MKRFRQWATEINTLLRTYRNLASVATDHGGITGESREFFVREILRRFLPRSVNVGTGQIIDSDNSLSNQIDVVVSRFGFPVLTALAMSDTFFIESVIAAIEVKSSLKGGKGNTLWEALDNSRSVKQLKLVHPSLPGSERPFREYNRLLPSTYIFGYVGYKRNLTYLKRAIYAWMTAQQEVSVLELPDIIVTEGCIVMTNKGTRSVFDSNKIRHDLGFDCIFLARKDNEALTWLLAHLLARIGGIHTGGQYDYLRHIWGVNYAVEAFSEKEWKTWGKWEYDEESRKSVVTYDDQFDSKYPLFDREETVPGMTASINERSDLETQAR